MGMAMKGMRFQASKPAGSDPSGT
ncbi:MAG: hypothetical protein JWM16_4207, partial [Verrucomicrobiales bacterium]|nr:hypothetical protein [Verrucomicrobiales bacterium]